MIIKQPGPSDMVKEFHTSCGMGDMSAASKDELAAHVCLRATLIAEEYTETMNALRNYALGVAVEASPHVMKQMKEGLLKEMSDLLYVVYGTADVLGLRLDEAFAAVHVNNMSKLSPDGKPIIRGDGKIMKPEGYQPVDLSHLV